jgi:hypothetical protein
MNPLNLDRFDLIISSGRSSKPHELGHRHLGYDCLGVPHAGDGHGVVWWWQPRVGQSAFALTAVATALFTAGDMDRARRGTGAVATAVR